VATVAVIAAIMNVLLSPQPPLFPHHHPDAARLPPSASRRPNAKGPLLSYIADQRLHKTDSLFSQTMSNRKRKADDDVDFGRPTGNDGGGGGFDDTMSVSPTASPAIATRVLARASKRARANEVSGRPLTLPRLLETLDAQSLRNVLRSICDQHPEIGAEVVSSAPRPSVASTLGVLAQYQEKLRDAFPFGGSGGSDYAYNRVRHALTDLIDALTEFTPHFLPPNETQVTTSLNFLDGATKVIHDLPNWESSSHKHHKDNAYDEISKAWALVISEASKKGGGFQLHNGEWDQKLNKHNEQSGGRMQVAVNALGSNLGWMGASPSTDTRDPGSLRNQLFSGTYGSNFPVRVGPW
jgi:protein Cut8